MKRFLLLLLALACVLAMVACGDEKKSSSKKDDDEDEDEISVLDDESQEGETDESQNGESQDGETSTGEDGEQSSTDEPAPEYTLDDAQSIVDSFLGAFVQLDAETIKSLCHDSESLHSEAFRQFEQIYSGDFSALLGGMGDSMAMFAGYEDKLQTMCEVLVDRMKSFMSYELGAGREAGGDTFIFEVQITLVDPATVQSKIAQQLTASFSEDKVLELVLELYGNGTITDSTTEEEMYDILIPIILDMMTEAVRTLDLPTTTISGEIAVTVKDGAFLIDLDHEEAPGIFA